MKHPEKMETIKKHLFNRMVRYKIAYYVYIQEFNG